MYILSKHVYYISINRYVYVYGIFIYKYININMYIYTYMATPQYVYIYIYIYTYMATPQQVLCDYLVHMLGLLLCYTSLEYYFYT